MCPERGSNPHEAYASKDFTRVRRFPPGADYLFTPRDAIVDTTRGAGRSSAGIIVGAHPASLCTFRGTTRTMRCPPRLGSGLPCAHGARLGFPEFTQFLTRALPRGRPNPSPSCLPVPPSGHNQGTPNPTPRGDARRFARRAPSAAARGGARKRTKCARSEAKPSEVRKDQAPPGLEPGIKVLQTSALPLGYGAEGRGS